MIVAEIVSWTQGLNSPLYYALSVVLVIAVLLGINMMSKVKTAVRGNLLGAGAMAVAVVLTLWNFQIFSALELYAAMLVGALIGVWWYRRIQMIQMPQTVALLNGFGGLASLLVGLLTLLAGIDNNTFVNVTGGLSIFVGGLTFGGSAVAAGKLHRLLNQRPVVFPGHAVYTTLSALVSLALVVAVSLPPCDTAGLTQAIAVTALVVTSILFGYFFAIRVGGADMPITISLLNSCSGLAGAIAGLAISDLLLVSVGAIVGASGLLLTQIMCQAMNRSLADILLGRTAGLGAEIVPESAAEAKSGETLDTASDTLVETGAETATAISSSEGSETIAATAPAEPVNTVSAREDSCVDLPPEEQAAVWAKEAQKIIIVPGYGMALAQAQESVRDLAQKLENAGKEVDFAIHPVAGRMPGHMNVLLAEVDVDYEKLREMKEIDDQFASTDLVFVVGANDVINPAANSAKGTPIYGMPVLSVAAAKHVVIMNFDLQPGYAGVENPLYAEASQKSDHVVMLLGDAVESLAKVMPLLD